MSDEEAIRHVVAAYVQRVDTGRIDEVLQLFAPDGVLEIVGQARHEGVGAIRAMFERGVDHLARSESLPRIRHHLTSHLIELDGADAARSNCYWLATVGTAGVDHWGRYVDDLRRSEDAWLIVRRRIFLDGAVPGGWGARGAEWNS
jgi:ketosteroid isomerase-like protein